MTGAQGWIRKSAALLLALLSAMVGLYLLGAFVGSRLPVNRDWRQPEVGVTIFVASNGIHTSLVLPVAALSADLRRLTSVRQVRIQGRTASYVGFGWGDRGFFLETPEWRDLDPGIVAGALIGAGPTLVHVDYLGPLRPGRYVRPVRLAPDQYRRLVDYVTQTFEVGPDGRATAIAGYGPDDLFFEANGRYSALHSCNDWTRQGLAAAGVRIGAWTPFAGGVMRWF